MSSIQVKRDFSWHPPRGREPSSNARKRPAIVVPCWFFAPHRLAGHAHAPSALFLNATNGKFCHTADDSRSTTRSRFGHDAVRWIEHAVVVIITWWKPRSARRGHSVIGNGSQSRLAGLQPSRQRQRQLLQIV